MKPKKFKNIGSRKGVLTILKNAGLYNKRKAVILSFLKEIKPEKDFSESDLPSLYRIVQRHFSKFKEFIKNYSS